MAYFEHIAILVGIYTILTISLNLNIGFTGLINLGHAAFYGIGAYTSALLTMAGIPWFISFLLAGIVASIFGFLISVPYLLPCLYPLCRGCFCCACRELVCSLH